uniref:Uncharacterized protein n=1 Tax=Leptocylindrus danicus TaxID=163516 RepID=A0A7S2JRX3_9STRA|mmetsp:Transcript_10359/g.15554  ORF Transcript_10359/g.15554 Transcript_10359/m.15554 type:complete len:344 (+) Transcript_10359:36-1067(+)|eukprot:CAMPEP_0116030770 /NCGR_PEP_ID=MMETSP0321-20121206/17067_1 /TAXON_ID=163516 /ORGANISM="Leptocylindrus danicus var. danicus, Strain B650" /LENGTH=343 /DNA_ID=CAMNT_0003505669 /DNA_START=16 /DNA_END=1047 /DNA_ORIENTATION=+
MSWTFGSSSGNKTDNYYENKVHKWGNSSSFNIQLLGCVWGQVDVDSGIDFGCNEIDSGDYNTAYWYKQAECRRAQVAYSISPANDTCNQSNMFDAFVTRSGLVQFAMALNGNINDGDADGDENAGGSNDNNVENNEQRRDLSSKRFPITYDDVYDLPISCMEDDYGYYETIGCASDGSFTVDQFEDAYCTQYRQTTNQLSDVNSLLHQLNCVNIYQDELYDTMSVSGTCSPINHATCAEAYGKKWKTHTSRKHRSRKIGFPRLKNPQKYQVGSTMLGISAFLIFLIVVNNRQKRSVAAEIRRRNREQREREEREREMAARKRGLIFRLFSRSWGTTDDTRSTS